MLELFKSIDCIPRIGKKRLEHYSKIGVSTPYDLLCYYPRSYIDFSSPVPIGTCRFGLKYTVSGVIVDKRVVRSRGYTIYCNTLTDSTTGQRFEVPIFNSWYTDESLLFGHEYVLYGKVSEGFNGLPQLSMNTFMESNDPVKLRAIYRLTTGLTNTMVSNNVKQCLSMFDSEPFETLTESILRENGLVSLQEALHSVHFPTCAEDVDRARRRLAFEEMLLLQLGMSIIGSTSRQGSSCAMHRVDMREFFESLPFEMTEGQLHAVDDVVEDMCREQSMNRIIQGDVGSGKTVVSMASCYFAYKNGYQSAVMAPTEILAQQHYESFSKTLEPLGVRVGYLTGSLSAKQKRTVRQQIEDGELDVVAGTHALIQEDTVFKNLGLVVTDEQHRFGVAQRSKLFNKGDSPNKLVMSATPIPRTLGLIIYGDLDISVISELPKGRQPVETFAVSSSLRNRAYSYVMKHLDDGGQAYIVCPMIDDSQYLQSVNEYARKLSKGVFSRYRVAILHGRMSSEQKDETMQSFKDGRVDVLISTTVIEVGVDVPNASIILIENAERFGLSQLHQLRGRVGRGSRKSACILIAQNASDDARQRLKVMCSTTDGFKIAEEDLKIRGCGDFFGERQHGLPTLKVADLVNDMELLEASNATAIDILQEDPMLQKGTYAPLRTEIMRMFATSSSD